jgi:hypothetical protein
MNNLREVVGFLCSVIRSGERLSAEDEAMIDKALAAPEPDLLDEAKRLLQKVADTLPRESRMWSLIDTFLQVLKEKPPPPAEPPSSLPLDHTFLPAPFYPDRCDRKIDDKGRPRTCARPLSEHKAKG